MIRREVLHSFSLWTSRRQVPLRWIRRIPPLLSILKCTTLDGIVFSQCWFLWVMWMLSLWPEFCMTATFTPVNWLSDESPFMREMLSLISMFACVSIIRVFPAAAQISWIWLLVRYVGWRSTWMLWQVPRAAVAENQRNLLSNLSEFSWDQYSVIKYTTWNTSIRSFQIGGKTFQAWLQWLYLLIRHCNLTPLFPITSLAYDICHISRASKISSVHTDAFAQSHMPIHCLSN